MNPRRQAPLPVEANINLAVIAQTIETTNLPGPAKLLQFPSQAPPVPQVDMYVGCCAGCGYAVYAADEHRVHPELACSECLAEERTWKVEFPVVAAVAA